MRGNARKIQIYEYAKETGYAQETRNVPLSRMAEICKQKTRNVPLSRMTEVFTKKMRNVY